MSTYRKFETLDNFRNANQLFNMCLNIIIRYCTWKTFLPECLNVQNILLYLVDSNNNDDYMSIYKLLKYINIKVLFLVDRAGN